jgi:hypothetical protein
VATRIRRAGLVGIPGLVAAALLIAAAGPAFAARLDPSSSEAQAVVSTPTGNDVSYPQCGHRFPSSPAFGIVGVNGGLANDLNPCLGPSSSYPSYATSELYWAVTAATGKTKQPKASLYVNTADPGNATTAPPSPTGRSRGRRPMETAPRQPRGSVRILRRVPGSTAPTEPFKT